MVYHAGFDQSKPLMILSSNSVNQAVITYGAPTSVVFSTLLATKTTDQVETRFEAITPDMIATILFTSGSTGIPKAVLNSHENLSGDAHRHLAERSRPKA